MNTYCKSLIITAVVSTLSIPVFALGVNGPASQPTPASTNMNQPGAHEAMKMVPAKALLSNSLDANKDHPNSTIEARLRNKVTLSDGTVLPSDTMLIGKIITDDMHEAGVSKLALRFNQARLKNGSVVPIKATIVNIITPGSVSVGDTTNGLDDNAPNDWTSATLGVDQIDVISGVDLHSRIASRNSGVFVSTTKHDVKLPDGSELQLAIGPRNKPMSNS